MGDGESTSRFAREEGQHASTAGAESSVASIRLVAVTLGGEWGVRYSADCPVRCLVTTGAGLCQKDDSVICRSA